MTPLGRGVFLAMIPVHVLMLFWVWIGRGIFGAGGWMFVFIMLAMPFLLVGLLATTLLAFRRSPSPHHLTPAQSWLHITMWAGMLIFGFFLVDFGDSPESTGSAFTQVFGESDASMQVSNNIAWLSVLVVIVAWLVLLGLLARKDQRAPA